MVYDTSGWKFEYLTQVNKSEAHSINFAVCWLEWNDIYFFSNKVIANKNKVNVNTNNIEGDSNV